MQLLHASNGSDGATLHKHTAQPLRQPSKLFGVGALCATSCYAHLAADRSIQHTTLLQACACA
jgi:hypothetical protein